MSSDGVCDPEPGPEDAPVGGGLKLRRETGRVVLTVAEEWTVSDRLSIELLCDEYEDVDRAGGSGGDGAGCGWEEQQPPPALPDGAEDGPASALLAEDDRLSVQQSHRPPTVATESKSPVRISGYGIGPSGHR